MGSRTPFEAWNGRKPQLGHMRVFGYKAHARTAKAHLTKLEDRSVPMVYLGVEEGSKAHRLYNPHTRRIVVSRDVVFQENVPWEWNAEFGENSEFVIEENVGETAQQNHGGVYGGDNHNDDPHDGSGRVPEHMNDSNHGDNHGQNQSDNEIGNGENLVQHSSGTQSETVKSQATVGENSVSHEADSYQGLSDDNMDIYHDDAPIRFRNIYEVYEEAAEVELTLDADVEVNALLTIMEEPTCYQDAADNAY
jgi:hypothetical protein